MCRDRRDVRDIPVQVKLSERAAGFPVEKGRPPSAGHGHGITAEDMDWMHHYQRRYFARLARVRGLST